MASIIRRSCISLMKLGLEKNVRTLYRCKHSGFLNRGQNRGPKRQEFIEVKKVSDENDEEQHSNLIESLNDLEYESIANTTLHVSTRQIEQQVFVIQPYVKWGPRKSNTKPEHQLSEAEALVRSIPQWNVAQSVKIGVDSLEKRMIFGVGQLEQLKSTIRDSRNTKNKISAVFVSKGTLTRQQKVNLENEFGVPVLDRYSVVIQILRLHATSAEAKLQVSAFIFDFRSLFKIQNFTGSDGRNPVHLDTDANVRWKWCLEKSIFLHGRTKRDVKDS